MAVQAGHIAIPLAVAEEATAAVVAAEQVPAVDQEGQEEVAEVTVQPLQVLAQARVGKVVLLAEEGQQELVVVSEATAATEEKLYSNGLLHGDRAASRLYE